MARPRIVVVGAGFAGYHAARILSWLSRGRAEIALVNPMDYFLYLPLLPEVAAGVIDPRRVAVSLPGTLPDVRLILSAADRIDLDARQVGWVDAEGDRGDCGYDRLVRPSAA
jgi:NADH dehydrogenase